MGKLAEKRRENEVKELLGQDNFDIKYQKVAYWQGQPVIIGKNELEGFEFELAGEGINHKYHHSYLENALTGDRKIFNLYFQRLSTLLGLFQYGENKGDMSECWEELLGLEAERSQFDHYNR